MKYCERSCASFSGVPPSTRIRQPLGNIPPGHQGAIATSQFRVQVAIGEVEIPIGLFHVRDEIGDARFEISQADVGVDACQQHAVGTSGCRVGTGDPIEFDTRSLQERLAVLGFIVDLVDAVESQRRIGDFGAVVVDVMAQGETSTCGGRLGQFEQVGALALLCHRQEQAGKRLVDAAVDLVPENARGELRIKGTECRFHAGSWIGFDQGRVEDRLRPEGEATTLPPRLRITVLLLNAIRIASASVRSSDS